MSDKMSDVSKRFSYTLSTYKMTSQNQMEHFGLGITFRLLVPNETVGLHIKVGHHFSNCVYFYYKMEHNMEKWSFLIFWIILSFLTKNRTMDRANFSHHIKILISQ